MKVSKFKCVAVTALVGVAVAGVSAFGEDNLKLIYGQDDRLDLYQVTDPALVKAADSTVALFKSAQLKRTWFGLGGKYKLATQPYGAGQQLCTTERFYEQRTGAFCSGSLVGPNLILTAGHCVTDENDCKDVRFVFGFALKEAGKQPTKVKKGEVYQCSKIIRRQQDGEGADYALIQLDRAVEGHTPLKINRSTQNIALGTQLVMIGHPTGLPVKVAGGAHVRKNDNPGFFLANTDSYGGNSGSAVLNANTGLIEGVLVRGDQDFRLNETNGCVESVVCGDEECRGEDVTKIANVADIIPAI